MDAHNNQLYLLEQHSESFEIWSTIKRINTEGKSLIMKLGPDPGNGIISLTLAVHKWDWNIYTQRKHTYRHSK